MNVHYTRAAQATAQELAPAGMEATGMEQDPCLMTAVLIGVFLTTTLGSILTVLLLSRRKLNAKELELKYREQLFSILVSTTDDIYVMFAAGSFAVEYVSPNVKKLLGIPVSDVMRDIWALTESAVDPSCEPSAAELERLGEGSFLRIDRERVCKATGERCWYQETLYRVSIGGEGKFVLVLSDRTKERTSSLRLQQALDIARSSNEAKSLFLANMSHDIRTPINAIVGMTRIAQESGEASKRVGDCLDAIAASSHYLLNLINDVLAMARIESGQIQLQEQRCEVSGILSDVEAIIGPQAQAKRQTLKIDCSGVVHQSFAGDELRISQILLNLASNAVKYTQEGGLIVLDVRELSRAKPNNARMQFSVSDNGMGMPQEFVERIFDPFERSTEASRSTIQGTGLGMSITKALIDAMGGIVEVDSEPGKGSTFRVVLELRLSTAPKPVVPSRPAEQPCLYDYAGKRFLLAEDNKLNAEILIELLGRRGAQIEWVDNGAKAVQMLAQRSSGPYDAVLMDVMMPVMNGYEAAREIRRLPVRDAAGVKIVALTANAFAEDIKTSLDAGMDAHVAKPVDIDSLARVLGTVCR